VRDLVVDPIKGKWLKYNISETGGVAREKRTLIKPALRCAQQQHSKYCAEFGLRVPDKWEDMPTRRKVVTARSSDVQGSKRGDHLQTTYVVTIRRA
jgi:hypothetical protein